jgi:hypothetical protein
LAVPLDQSLRGGEGGMGSTLLLLCRSLMSTPCPVAAQLSSMLHESMKHTPTADCISGLGWQLLGVVVGEGGGGGCISAKQKLPMSEQNLSRGCSSEREQQQRLQHKLSSNCIKVSIS